MQTMMGEATIQQVAFSFNDLWSSPIGFHRLRLQSDNSTERSSSIQIEIKQHHTLQQTEDRVESGYISTCCSKDDYRGDDGCGVDHIGDGGGDVDRIGDDGGDVDHIGDGDFRV